MMAKLGKAHKKQVCPVCGVEIEPGEDILSHPELKRWVHPACAKENSEGGEEMNTEKTKAGNLQGILDQLKPEQRGMLTPPPTEEEKKQTEVQTTQAMLTRTLRSLLKACPMFILTGF